MNKLKILNRDAVKYLAIIVMFWGHLGWAYNWNGMELPLWLSLTGNISLMCPPVMFFMVGDGYKYSHDRKKYAIRLLIFASITQLIQCLIMHGWEYANVIFTMFFGLLELMVWHSKLKTWQKIGIIAALILFNGLLLGCEWGFFGDLSIIFLYVFRENPKKRLIAFTSVMLLWQGLALIWNPPLGCLARFAAVMASYACMTLFYSGKKGHFPKFSKWFFYIFYPAHYIVIYFYSLYIK